MSPPSSKASSSPVLGLAISAALTAMIADSSAPSTTVSCRVRPCMKRLSTVAHANSLSLDYAVYRIDGESYWAVFGPCRPQMCMARPFLSIFCISKTSYFVAVWKQAISRVSIRLGETICAYFY